MTLTVTENYLKAIYNAGEWSTGAVTISALAQRLGIAVSTVSEQIQKLVERGLVSHPPYGDVELTESGRALALATVRKHRLIETFLVEYLDYGWDEVHDEAEVLEHAVSDLFVERLYERLGKPARDPHGDPIPTADGSIFVADEPSLDEIKPGTRVEVVRVWDDDPEFLRKLHDGGLRLNTHITVTERDAAFGTITVTSDVQSLSLATGAARAIRVRILSDENA